jgi:hypothetical protein
MKLNDKQKDTLLKLFIFALIQAFCLFYYVIVSRFAGTFNWTVQELTTNSYGTIVQILNLIMFLNGIIIFLYIVFFLIWTFKR